jgi:type I restriction enzyme S subunit
LPESTRVEGDVPVVSSSGITGHHNVAIAQPPGVVTGRYGTLGEVFFVEEPYWPLNTALYAIDFHGNDPLFCAYFLRKVLSRTQSDKAAVPGVNRNDLHKIPVKVPDPTAQKSIAAVLKKYDALIENNRRRIALLEQAARLLYEEWFVRFRFPGHEHVRMSNGLPEGWYRKPASDCMNIHSGGTPKTDNTAFWDGEIPFFTPKDADPSVFVFDTEKHLTEQGLKACNSKLYSENTLLITARGTVGKMNLAGQPMAMNQSCYALIAYAPLSQEFLYFAMSFGVKELRSQAGGAVFDAIIRDTFKFISVVVPLEEIVKRFTEIVHPYLKSTANLQAQIRSLQKALDLLLPRLMSGEVEV